MEKKNIKSIIKDNYIWIILLILVIIVVLVGININSSLVTKFDNFIYSNVSKLISDFTTNIMKLITNFGSVLGLAIMCILLMIFIKNKKYGLYAFLNAVGVGFLNLILKIIFQRPRPNILQIINESGYSFPSGHSMASMAFYGLLIYYIYKKVENKKIRRILILLFSILILAVGISRIYLGVHYPSDVICGYIISLAYLIGFIKFIEMEELNGTNK